MSYNLIGALVGLAFAVVEFFMFGIIINRAQTRGERGGGAHALDLVRKGQIVAFPLIGWFVGPIFASAMGGQ